MTASGPSTGAVIAGVVAWYVSNIAILITNKVLLNPTGFRRPITLTLGHALTCSLMGGMGAFFKVLPWQPLQSTKQATNVAWLSLVFCLTIVAANASLKDVSVGFNQAVGSSTPVFTALFAFACHGKRESALTYATLLPIVLGVMVACHSEPEFHLVGFTLCLSAAACRAFKSVLQAMLMTDPDEQLNPHSLLFYMSSASVLLLLPVSLVMEPGALVWLRHLMDKGGRAHFTEWLVSNLVLSYSVNYTNFLVTKLTSALTLQVLGNMKGVVATIVSLFFFVNTITWRFVVGYTIVMAGVWLYSAERSRQRLDGLTYSHGDPPPVTLLLAPSLDVPGMTVPAGGYNGGYAKVPYDLEPRLPQIFVNGKGGANGAVANGHLTQSTNGVGNQGFHFSQLMVPVLEGLQLLQQPSLQMHADQGAGQGAVRRHTEVEKGAEGVSGDAFRGVDGGGGPPACVSARLPCRDP